MLALALTAATASAERLRIATWGADMSRRGPGLLVQDLVSGRQVQVASAVRVIAALDADVLLLTDFDWDHGNVALTALADRLSDAGVPYPYRLALQPNRGLRTGQDLDGDGRTNGPDDAQGWGLFPGHRGMALLSRLPVDSATTRDLSGFLWRDLPGAILPPMSPGVAAIQRLSTTGHWIVPVMLADGRRLEVLAFSASPPVFDGDDDRNGRRNHDETAIWLRLLHGDLPLVAPAAPFVILGDANLDAADGDGRPEALRELLADPRVQDTVPRGRHGRTEQGHQGDPALDTAWFDAPLGGLRLHYVLPSADLLVADSGVLWPPEADPLAALLATASRHRPVWVDIELPD